MLSRVIWPPAGRYILAVSGGADSMVLQHLMAAAAGARNYELIVAHFDHGLRPDSAADRRLVQGAAARAGLAFVAHAAHLGAASEAHARSRRHAWLERLRQEQAAGAVVTAHHQDDLIETSLLNLARGTGRRGLAPMQSGAILRPLLALTRADLRAYAAHHHIVWREDPTNADISNPRNFLRHRLLSHATPDWRAQYTGLISRLAALNQSIDASLGQLLAAHRESSGAFAFPRPLVQDLSLAELAELLAFAALSLVPDAELDRRLITELALFAKIARPHRRRPLRAGLELLVYPELIHLHRAPDTSQNA